MTRCRLYLITPPKLEPRLFAETLKRALQGGDVASVQLRLKDASDEDILRAGEILLPVTQRAGAAFILNDRPDLAAKLGADGVHVGQEDASYADARAAMGANRIVGVTCHDSRHLADRGGGSGRGLRRLRRLLSDRHERREDPGRTRAIALVGRCDGGAMRRHRRDHSRKLRPLIEAGADFLAVASGVWDHPAGPDAAVKAFNALF